MATYAEIVYSVLDLMKELHDDAYYTEEHVLFLAKKYRALLIERKYNATRNSSFKSMSEENKQQACFSLEPATLLPDGCGGNWLKSTAKMPELLNISYGIACTGHDLLDTVVEYIPAERMRYVGYNKWLKNIIYASRSQDGYLYLKSSNPQFVMLEHVGLTAIYADPEEAEKLSHEACMNGGLCDVMTEGKRFPLESSLVPLLIEMVFQELSGQRYAPQDKKNDASDGLGDIATASRPVSPATNSTYKSRE